MKRHSKLTGPFCMMLLALAALAVVATNPTPARAVVQCVNSVNIQKSCVQDKVVGEKNDCTITVTNTDTTCNNTIRVNSNKDVVHATDGDVTNSNLPISAVVGTTTCVVGSFAVCTLAPNASASFHDTSYTIKADDAPTLGDTGTVNINNLCDVSGLTNGCATGAVDENQVSATSVLTCSVTIDKQISCDGGVTWADAATASAGPPITATGACTGFTGDPIQVRYVYQNTGDATLNSCNIHDVTGQSALTTGGTAFTQDTSVGTLSSGGAAITSSVITTSNGTDLLTCNANGPNYDSANIDCVCGTSTIHADAHDTANFSCETCSVEIDKQVKCGTGSFVDVFGTDDSENTTVPPTADTVTDSCTGVDAFTGHTADNIAVQYVIKNTGADAVNTCTYGETNAAITGSTSTITGAPPTIDPMTTFTPNPTFTHACSDALVQNEGSGDTAMISCHCNALPNNSLTKTASFTDTALFKCLAPGLTVSKTCHAQTGGTTNTFTVDVSNNGGVDLTGCSLTDAYQANDTCSTPPIDLVSPVDATSTSSLSPSDYASFDLGHGATTEYTGSLSGLSANACNQASVTCTIAGTAQTITATSQSTCTVGAGCDTRTPGFWGTHPTITQEVINDSGGGLLSCGLDITMTDASANCSATQDICSVGSDSNTLGIDPSDMQLVRQCMAAEINFAASAQDGGNCSNTVTGIANVLTACCGAGGVCATGGTAVGLNTVSSCIGALDAFNSLETTITNSKYLTSPGPADSSQCQIAGGDGVVNPNDGTGAGTFSGCGGSRTYASSGHTNNGHHGKP
jgi:hypothetical protein